MIVEKSKVALVALMEGQREATTLEAWQRDWVERTRVERAEEDAKFNEEYDSRRSQLRLRLVELYDRRQHFEAELRLIQDSILFGEEQQEHLLREYNDSRRRIETQRDEQDRSQQEWYDRSRQGPQESRINGYHLPPITTTPREMGSAQSASAGAGGVGWTSINGTRLAGIRNGHLEDDEQPPADPGNLVGSAYHPVDDPDVHGRALALRTSANGSRLPSNGVDMDLDDTEALLRARKDGERVLKPKQRHSLPSFSEVIRSPSKTKQEILDDGKPRSASARRSLPGVKEAIAENEVSDGIEINRETLILKHNGTIYTEPALLYGVPVERIGPSHPFWDSEWQPLEEVIGPALRKWQDKLENLKRTPDSVRHTVFLANRQVNRGQAVMDFLKTSEFHPYQFVGKETMSKFYKTFINYDTMFRLVNIHEELKKFDLDITPLEWLRQRTYEISMAQGDKFSLSKYTHDLYHDAKIKMLREKHGFGNIGRPSGYKVGDKEKAKPKVKREPSSGTVRKKGRRSIGQVDRDDSPMVMEGQPLQSPQDYLEPGTPRLQKRARTDGPPTPKPGTPAKAAPAPAKSATPAKPLPPPPSEDELDTDGFTSTDSFSAGRIMHLDWRVYQIKTVSLTTSPEVTQYWTWKGDKNVFEHQVLRDVYPKVTWGYYQKHTNFDLKLTEIIEMEFANQSQKVVIKVKDEKRGQVLAFFKRNRTKKRFLSFARRKGVKLVRKPIPELEESWATMESNTLPGGGDSDS